MDMLDELQNWWQSTTPEMRVPLQQGSLVLAALIGGYVGGSMVARALRARNCDAALRVAGSSPPAPEGSRGFVPTTVAGPLVRLTVWAAAAWWLARQYGQVDLATTLGL